MHIYVQNLSTLSILAALVFLAFTAVLYVTRNNVRLIKAIAAIILIVAIYGILSYTVLGRMPSDNYTFVFAATHSSESDRKMIMNALLYYPLGLSLTALIGSWSILAAFLLSMEYIAGTGIAQGTDVIMNKLGAAIGALPYVIVKQVVKRQKAQERPDEQPKREREKS